MARNGLILLAVIFACLLGDAVGFLPGLFVHRLGKMQLQPLCVRGHLETTMASRLRMVEEDKSTDEVPVGDVVPAVPTENESNEEPDTALMVGPFNLKDFNDWISIFLYSVITWQSIGIVTDIYKGVSEKIGQ